MRANEKRWRNEDIPIYLNMKAQLSHKKYEIYFFFKKMFVQRNNTWINSADFVSGLYNLPLLVIDAREVAVDDGVVRAEVEGAQVGRNSSER